LKTIYLENMGCSRNLVDSEIMLGHLTRAHCMLTDDPSEAEVIIVNTCSFILNAIDESIDTILELAQLKQSGNCRCLIVTGCLPERFGENIVHSLPEVDIFLGTGAYDRIVDAVEGRLDGSKSVLPDPNTRVFPAELPPRVLSVSHTAYMKVAEGCDRHCSYCIIPKLRGRQRSRPLQTIIAEARSLIDTGVKEIILVAENTTDYGRDLKPSLFLHDVMDRISCLSPDMWLRVLYGHPESIDEAFIQTVSNRDNICPYFDIPVQHASDTVLKQMGRTYTRDDLYRLFTNIRQILPEAVLRTTVIAGFPGESAQDFDILKKFVEDIGFDHLGVFQYSDSEDLASHHLKGHVPKSVAEARQDQLMGLQAEISRGKNEGYVGKILPVLIEEEPETGLYLGRTRFQAPDVDGLTCVYASQPVAIGDIVDVTITDAFEYDLAGEIS
jgi:ribosomal protein S12 methylthiotransferase